MHQGRKNRSSNRHERIGSQQSWRWPSSLSPRMAINALITVCCLLLLVIHFLWRPVGLPGGLPGRTGTLLWPPRGFVALRDGSLTNKCSRTRRRLQKCREQAGRKKSTFVSYMEEQECICGQKIGEGVIVRKLGFSSFEWLTDPENRTKVPQLGFGTAGLGQMTEQATTWALKAGYRLIDSAQATEWYDEKAVGRAIRTLSIRRDELFLVSKLHPRNLGYELTKTKFSSSLEDLGTSYVDLFLLHYPRCFAAICGDFTPAGSWQESWKALEDLHDELKIKAIGVSNFDKEELEELVAFARLKPFVVQRNSDPFSSDLKVQEFCHQEGIQYMGYSTLGSQWLMRGVSTNPVLKHPTIQRISVAQNCTCAQVVLSWALHKHQVVVPRSSKHPHIVENLNAQNCYLRDIQVKEIDALDGHVPQ